MFNCSRTFFVFFKIKMYFFRFLWHQTMISLNSVISIEVILDFIHYFDNIIFISGDIFKKL